MATINNQSSVPFYILIDGVSVLLTAHTISPAGKDADGILLDGVHGVYLDGKYYSTGAIKVCSLLGAGRMTLRDMPSGGVSVEIDSPGKTLCRGGDQGAGAKSVDWCKAHDWPIIPLKSK